MTAKTLGSISAGMLLLAAEAGESPSKNLACNAPVTLITASANPSKDARKLTDGLFAPGTPISGSPESTLSYFGWSPFLFQVDLGKVQSIGGIALHSQVDQNTPLDCVFICGSKDGKTWYPVAEISTPDNPKAPGYPRWVYRDMNLNSQARYLKVALIARSLPQTYYFDEFEVYPASTSKATETPAGSTDYTALLNDTLTRTGSRKRLATDLATLRKIVGNSYENEIQALERQKTEFKAPGAKNFSSIYPQNTVQKGIYQVFARYLRDTRKGDWFLWSPYRYHFATPFDLPGIPFSTWKFKVLGGESHTEILTLLNAGPEERRITIEVSGSPEALKQLSVHEMPWTDTAEGISVSTIMRPITLRENRFDMSLPSGLSSRLAFTFDGGRLPAGTYPLQLKINGRLYTVAAEVSPVRLPEKQKLLVGTWDYTDKLPALGLTEKNVASAIRLMDTMRINVPWGGGSIAFPQESDFNSKGDFIGNLKSEKFEQWLRQRPGKPMYCVFINVEAADRNNIGSYRFGTPGFEVRAANWIRAWDQRLQQLGLKPGQVQWLLVDEVWDDHKAAIQTAWSKAFQAAKTVVLRNWNNPVVDVREKRFAEMIELIDSLCSSRDRQYEKEYLPFYLKQQAKGKEWWTYSCNGPSRLFDPFSYYRMHGLGSWKDGIRGIGIWSFGDNGGAPAWNEYLLRWAIFAPTAITETEVLPTLALEAFREGIEDFELFSLLEQRVPQLPEQERSQAKALLEELRKYIVANTNVHIKWYDAEAKLDRRGVDKLRLRAITLLESAVGKNNKK